MLADAAVAASARRVTAVMPWLGYARQDQRRGPESIGARVVARALEAVGVDGVIAVDLHAPQVPGFFSCPVDHVSALPLLADALEPVDPATVVVAVQADRVTAASWLAHRLGLPLAAIDDRGGDGAIVGQVAGRPAIVLDDIVDTGATIGRAADVLEWAGAGPVTAVATHGVFSPPAAERLRGTPLERIVVTDTLPQTGERPLSVPTTVVPVAGLVAATVRRVFRGQSLDGMGPPVVRS